MLRSLSGRGDSLHRGDPIMRNDGLRPGVLLVWCAAVAVFLIGTSTIELPFRPVPAVSAVAPGAPPIVPAVAAEPREPGAIKVGPMVDGAPRLAATPTAVPTVGIPLTSAPTAESSVAPPTAPEPIARWLQTTRETRFWAGPDVGAPEFVKAPPGSVILALETRGPRTLGYFGGDRDGRKPGEVWVDTPDLGPARSPQWVRGHRQTSMQSAPGAESTELAALPPGTFVELVGEQQGRWARAFYAGDGRLPGPVVGWVDLTSFAMPIIAQDKLGGVMLNRATYEKTEAEVWLRVPYRSQLDGSAYAEANCGPTSVGMVLEAFGRAVASGTLRAAALKRQGVTGCDGCGLFIQNLAAVIEANGVPTYSLRSDTSDRELKADKPSNEALRRWTVDEIRAQLRAGRVVIPQVMYRFLPSRADSPYWGDHFIVVTGIIGDSFLYNDPIDSDGNGYGRVITAAALERAMAESDVPYAAFAAGR
jgi:hypothetical protein